MMTIVLQSSVTKDCLLLLKYNLSCQQFPEMCCFTVSDFSSTILMVKLMIYIKRQTKNLSSNKPLNHG